MILAEVAKVGVIAQSELVRITGLSRATVASVVSDLLRDGRLTATIGHGTTATDAAGRGRPPRYLSLQAETGYVIAIDSGHAHLSVAIADRSGAVLVEDVQTLDVDGSSSEVLERAQATVRRLVEQQSGLSWPPAAIVMGVPGPIDISTGQMRSGSLLPGWVGVNPAQELQALIGRPVWVENDANLCALGELAFGVAQGVRDFLYVKASSGIGAGVVMAGGIYRGSRGTAGEIGHVQVREEGAICRCGSRGCLETVSSADTALAFLRQVHGQELTFDEAMAIVRAKDPGAVRLLNDMGLAVGKVVAMVCSNLDPAMIVVGGRMIDPGSPFLEGVSAAVHRFTQPYVSDHLRVVAGALGSRAALMGAVAEANRLASGF